MRALTEALGHGARVRRGRHRLPRPPGRRAGDVRRPRRHRDLRQGHRRRAADRPRRRVGTSTWTRSTEARWQYGDDSIPEVGVTFFAGTFVRHPLALAAARAVLGQLEEQGPGSAARPEPPDDASSPPGSRPTRGASGAPVRITHFSSWFYVDFPTDVPHAGLFYAMMRDRGVHVWEGRCWFLTTAHTDADLELVFAAFRETLAEMQAGDLLPGRRRAAGTRSPPGPRRRRPRGVVRARSGAPGQVPAASRRPQSPMADARPALRPVDFDPFAPASGPSDAACLSPSRRAEMWTAAAMSPRSELLVQPVLRLRVRRARCGSSPCAPRSIRSWRAARRAARRHRSRRLQPDDRAAVLASTLPLLDLSDVDPEAPSERSRSTACCNTSAKRRSTSPRAR